MQFHPSQLHWVLKSTDWYFFLSFSLNWGGSIFPLCNKSSLQCSRLVFHGTVPPDSVRQRQRDRQHQTALFYSLSGHSQCHWWCRSHHLLFCSTRSFCSMWLLSGYLYEHLQCVRVRGKNTSPYLIHTLAVPLLPLLPPDIPSLYSPLRQKSSG